MMSRNNKALWIVTILLTSLACNLPFAINGNGDSPTRTQPAISTQSQASGTQPPTQAKGTQPPVKSNSTPELTYFVSVRVEVSSLINPVSVTKYYAYYDARTPLARVYVIVENSSTDPLDIVTEYSGKVTWYDDKNQVIDSIPFNMLFTNIFPQEKQLLESYLEKSKMTDRKISLVRVEVTKVVTVKSWDSAWKDKISKQKWSHPFATPKQVSFDVTGFMGGTTPMGTSKVTIQNNMNSKIIPRVVGLYYNGKNELVGVGKSASFELPALGSANADLMTLNLCAEPVKMEYFIEMPSTKSVDEMMALLFP